MTSNDSQDRIEALRRRWEEDPSSRVFVQLADEYRRAGRTDEAIQVLETGLERQPGYVSAQVALARCRLAQGQTEHVVELLDGVVSQDPGHLLANKLLVEAHLEAGREEQARMRLEVYRMIADADPELEQLEERLASLSESPRDAETSETQTDPTGPGLAAPADAGEPLGASVAEASQESGPGDHGAADEEDIFGLGESDPIAPGALSGDWTDAPEETATDLAAAEPPAADSSDEDPFGDLLAGPVSRTPAAEDEEDLFGLSARAAEAPALVTRTEEPPTTDSRDTEDSPVPDALPEAEAKTETETPPAEEGPSARTAEASESTRPSAVAQADEPQDDPEEKATVTLGQLYLSQGHEKEAERIFHRVLRREPGNSVALRALAELERRRTKASEDGEGDSAESAEVPEPVVELTESRVEASPAPQPDSEPEPVLESASKDDASETEVDRPLPDFPVPDEIRQREGLTNRKVALLSYYLERLRADG